MVREWLNKARSFFTGKRRTEVDEELQFHIDRETEANLAAGMIRRSPPPRDDRLRRSRARP